MNEHEMKKKSQRHYVLSRLTRKKLQIRRMVIQDYPLFALWRILFRTVDTMRGMLSAFIVGWPKSYLGAGSRIIGTRSIQISEGIAIGRHAWIEAVTHYGEQIFTPVITIGKGFCAAESLHVAAINRIEIGDNCLFGSGIYIADHNHGSYAGDEQSSPSEPPVQRKLFSRGEVVIGSNVWLGDNVVIVGAVRIGSGVVIGANSVVTHDIPKNVIVAGVPAKIIKQYNQVFGKWEKVSANSIQHEIHL